MSLFGSSSPSSVLATCRLEFVEGNDHVVAIGLATYAVVSKNTNGLKTVAPGRFASVRRKRPWI